MKQTIILFTLALSTFVYSQVGVKAGLTYNADEGLYKSSQNTYTNKGKGSIGYHIGLYKRLQLTGLYVQPEVLYVSYKNDFTDQNGKNIDIKYKRIDVPVSIGTSVMKLAYLQAGPVFSYYFKNDINVRDITNIEQKDLAIALQVGGGVTFQNLDIGIRYDFPLGNLETKWVQKNYDYSTESSPKLLHVSLGYNF